MTNPLDELALEHGTDKSSAAHGYTEAYWSLLSGMRENKLKLLEIGVLGGASLRMWADFFPYATLYGLDRDPETLQYETERARIFIGDQTDERFLADVTLATGTLDVIIDDGGHHPDQVMTSLRALFPHLAEGGLYVIEDVATAFSPRYGPDAGLGNPGSHVEFFKSLLDVLLGHPDYGGVFGDQITSRIRSAHFHHNIAVLVKGRADDRLPQLADSDRRVHLRSGDHPVERARAGLRRLRRRVSKNTNRLFRDLTGKK